MAKSNRPARRGRPVPRRDYTRWIIGGAIAAVVVVIALIALSANTPPPTASSALDKCGSPECGPANAPVTVEEYSDFQ